MTTVAPTGAPADTSRTGARPGVLMVTGAYFPEMSGAGLQCRAYTRQLRGAIDATVLTTTTDRALRTEDNVDGVRVHRVFVDPASAWSKATAVLRMVRVFLRERRSFSILHLHGFSQKSILLIALGLVAGKRIALTFHSVGHDDPISMRSRGRLAYWWYTRAHLFSGVGPRFETLYQASGLPREKFRLIPNGVDLERFRPATLDERRALRDALGLPQAATVILFVGFFSREKCPDLLFDAWARATACGETSSVLVFVGATRSSYYEVDERLAECIRSRATQQGLDDRVYFVDPTPEIEMYHRAADIFALPSVREGLPCALQEAMACGTACVATRLEGVTDALIEDGASGILIPPRDVAALEAALALLVSHPDRARAMGARARERIMRDFALANTAREYLAVYRELAAS